MPVILSGDFEASELWNGVRARVNEDFAWPGWSVLIRPIEAKDREAGDDDDHKGAPIVFRHDRSKSITFAFALETDADDAGMPLDEFVKALIDQIANSNDDEKDQI